MWDVASITFEIVADMTDDPVVMLLVDTPAGRLSFVAEPVMEKASTGRETLVLRGTHVQGLSRNEVGTANLRVMAQAVMEGMDCDELVVEGAVRTTGAGPGRQPRPMRFPRRVRPTPAAGPPVP